MKLNTDNFDQASFSHSRVMLCLLWLRCKRFTPNALRVSFRDMIFVYLEHNYSEMMSSIKALCSRVLAKIRPRRG